MTQPLAGLLVVVTRPARQAARFRQLLDENGAATVAFPALAIEPLPIDAATRSALAPDRFDWVVYTSANAVEQSLGQLGRPSLPRIAAIGRATARALESAGIHVHAVPSSGADSEALIALPEFAALDGCRVLIVKGVGGRDALRRQFTERGATVALAEVYRRVSAVPPAGALEALRRACATGSAVVAVTSVEGLESLLQLAPETRVPQLRDARLLLPGERVAAAARRNGWRGALVVARSAEDDAMLEALLAGEERDGAPGPA